MSCANAGTNQRGDLDGNEPSYYDALHTDFSMTEWLKSLLPPPLRIQVQEALCNPPRYEGYS